MVRKSSFDLQGLLACARGELFGEGNARLPLPPLLMFDRITRIASSLRDHWKVDEIAPGHCTGEPAFAELQRVFGTRYVYAGLGVVTTVP